MLEMNAQTIWLLIGVISGAIAFILALAAIIYFVRADVRSVMDELSGKRFREEFAAFDASSSGKGDRKAQFGNAAWQGAISKGQIDSGTSDEATTGEKTTASPDAPQTPSHEEQQSSGQGDDGLTEVAVDAETIVDFDADTIVSDPVPPIRKATIAPLETAVTPKNSNAVVATKEERSADDSFVIVRRLIVVHSDSVIDSTGEEIECQ